MIFNVLFELFNSAAFNAAFRKFIPVLYCSWKISRAIKVFLVGDLAVFESMSSCQGWILCQKIVGIDCNKSIDDFEKHSQA